MSEERWEQHQEMVELGERMEAKLDRIIELLTKLVDDRPAETVEIGEVEVGTYFGETRIVSPGGGG